MSFKDQMMFRPEMMFHPVSSTPDDTLNFFVIISSKAHSFVYRKRIKTWTKTNISTTKRFEITGTLRSYQAHTESMPNVRSSFKRKSEDWRHMRRIERNKIKLNDKIFFNLFHSPSRWARDTHHTRKVLGVKR